MCFFSLTFFNPVSDGHVKSTLFTTIKFPANKCMKIEFFFANQVFALFYRLELTQQLKAAVRRNETLESELRETKKRLRLAEAAGEAANRDTTSAQQSLESLKFRLQEMEAMVALERRKYQEKEAKKAQLETRDRTFESVNLRAESLIYFFKRGHLTLTSTLIIFFYHCSSLCRKSIEFFKLF